MRSFLLLLLSLTCVSAFMGGPSYHSTLSPFVRKSEFVAVLVPRVASPGNWARLSLTSVCGV